VLVPPLSRPLPPLARGGEGEILEQVLATHHPAKRGDEELVK
jgi:hypothetical protein